MSQINKEETDKKLKELKEFAEKELECKLLHLAIAWSLKFKYISSSLIGARNPEQVTESLKSLEIAKKLTPEVEEKVNKILKNHPETRTIFQTFTPEKPIRPYPS